MYVGFNEHSLHGQFSEELAWGVLDGILRCRELVRTHGDALRCRRAILEQTFVGPVTLGEFLRHIPAHDSRKRICLSWLQREGPFLEDDLLHNMGMEFTWEDELVTDGMLAELAHRERSQISTPM